LVERLEKERIMDAVRAHLALATSEEDWDFALAEQAFGGDGDPWPAITLRAGGEALRLRGRIDRIDVGHATARVRAIDYKRSRSQAIESWRRAGETVFQVPLYALHAARELGRGGAEGAYLPTTRRNLEAFPAPSPKSLARWTELVRAARSELAPVEASALE